MPAPGLIWSGATWSKNTKNSGLVEIKNPRFHFTGFNQNFFLINLILKGNNYDGFLTRFLVATPQEIYTKLGDKINAGDQDDTVDMQNIMNIIYRKYINGCTFKLSEEALHSLTVYHDDDVLVNRMNDKYDDLKGSLLSKSISNVIRVAAVQCALSFGVEKENDIADSNDITVSEGDKLFMYISGENMIAAINIVKYSVKCITSLVDSAKKTTKQKLKAKRTLNLMPEKTS